MSTTQSSGAIVLSFVNQGGGCGKSTLSVHAAAWLADQGCNVAVIDADSQATTKTWLAAAAPNIKCFSLSDPDDITNTIAKLKPHLDVIVADGPPRLQADARALLKASDKVILPVIPSPVNARSTMQAVQTIERLGRFKERGDDFAVAVFNIAEEAIAHTKWVRTQFAVMGVAVASVSIGKRYIYRQAAQHQSVAWRLPVLNKSYTQAARLATEEFETLLSEVLPNDLKSKGRISVRLQRYQPAGRRGAGTERDAGADEETQAA